MISLKEYKNKCETMSCGDLYNVSPQNALSPRAFKNHKKSKKFEIPKNRSIIPWGMFQGRYIPNFIELAQLEMLKKSGELSVQRRIKKEERYISWIKIGRFQSPIKSEPN